VHRPLELLHHARKSWSFRFEDAAANWLGYRRCAWLMLDANRVQVRRHRLFVAFFLRPLVGSGESASDSSDVLASARLQPAANCGRPRPARQRARRSSAAGVSRVVAETLACHTEAVAARRVGPSATSPLPGMEGDSGGATAGFHGCRSGAKSDREAAGACTSSGAIPHALGGRVAQTAVNGRAGPGRT
jgi:hypothetical protein